MFEDTLRVILYCLQVLGWTIGVSVVLSIFTGVPPVFFVPAAVLGVLYLYRFHA